MLQDGNMAQMADRIESWWGELERTAKLMGQVGPDEICCEGLTARQCSILRTLARQEGARLTDLAVAAEITPSAMTRIVEKLEKAKLVRRLRGRQKDGRAAMVQITEEGRRVRGRIDQLMVERTQAILTAIPEETRTPLLNALRLLNDCIERSECCAPRQPKTGAAEDPACPPRQSSTGGTGCGVVSPAQNAGEGLVNIENRTRGE